VENKAYAVTARSTFDLKLSTSPAETHSPSNPLSTPEPKKCANTYSAIPGRHKPDPRIANANLDYFANPAAFAILGNFATDPINIA
jgi:hypothetical protein